MAAPLPTATATAQPRMPWEIELRVKCMEIARGLPAVFAMTPETLIESATTLETYARAGA